jgi:hypothetical protein
LTEGIMSGFRLRFVGLCLPPILFSLLDALLTLMGQSAQYWAGDYARVNEVSPTFNALLAIHPLAFLAGSAVWLGVVVGFLLLVPETLALIVSIAVVFGHTVGASSWLQWRFEYGYQFCNGLFLLAAIVLGLSIRYGWRAAPAEEYRIAMLPAPWRWLLASALFGVGVYLFLWPRSA